MNPSAGEEEIEAKTATETIEVVCIASFATRADATLWETMRRRGLFSSRIVAVLVLVRGTEKEDDTSFDCDVEEEMVTSEDLDCVVVGVVVVAVVLELENDAVSFSVRECDSVGVRVGGSGFVSVSVSVVQFLTLVDPVHRVSIPFGQR